jgi:acetyltransferase-like isoleucine patch superfamily enzyme
MNEICIFGVATPYAEEIVESAERLNLKINLINNLNLPTGNLEAGNLIIFNSNLPIIVAPASSTERASAVLNSISMGANNFVNILDPTSAIASTVKFGCGNYVNSLVSIGSSTVFSCHTNINRNSTIGHHCEISSFVTTGPTVVLCGFVSVGVGTFIGAGAVILPKVKIGKNVVVGAGAVVTRDLPDDVVAIGNPAKIMRMNQPMRGLDRCPIHFQ